MRLGFCSAEWNDLLDNGTVVIESGLTGEAWREAVADAELEMADSCRPRDGRRRTLALRLGTEPSAGQRPTDSTDCRCYVGELTACWGRSRLGSVAARLSCKSDFCSRDGLRID
jgi:hypothetical protein